VQIVVADNASTDGSVEWLKKHYPHITLIEFEENYGFTGGYNRALLSVHADYFMLLNSDVEVCEGWIENLLSFMEDNPDVGISMPKIKSESERDSFEYAGAAGGFIDLFGFPFCRGRILSNIEKDEGQYNQPREVFWASGAAFMIRSSLFHTLGGFDDLFFAHMEEIDLCWRAKLAGWQVWVYPDSQVYHVGGGTLPNNSPRKLFYNYRNNLLMLYKNLSPSRLWPVLMVRFMMDCMSAVMYVLQGKGAFFKSVCKAHRDFHRLRKVARRDNVASTGPLTQVYNGSVVFSFFLKAGKLRFREFGHRIR
jgi:GT2 family glycosyltransferase